MASVVSESLPWSSWLQEPLENCELLVIEGADDGDASSCKKQRPQWQFVPWDTSAATLTEALQALGFETLTHWQQQAHQLHQAFSEVMYAPATLGCYSAVCDAITMSPHHIPFSIEWMLTDYEGIQALNLEQRQEDAPTDVLSFPMWQGRVLQEVLHSMQAFEGLSQPIADSPSLQHPPEPLLVGSIAVCVPWVIQPRFSESLSEEDKQTYQYPFLQTPPSGMPRSQWVFWMLCVHGLLHIHNIHHDTPEAFEHMTTLQHTILNLAFSS